MHMLRLARPVIYPLALLVGSLFVVAAALAHPDLTGDGAAQLSVIARSEAWRAFGWAVINGKVLPRRLGAGAVTGGLIASGLALAFPESTKADEAAFVLPVLWQVVTGAALLRRP